MEYLVDKWENREILFPKNSVFTIQCKDTVKVGFSRNAYKVVMYVDSLGCTDCKLQLAKWKDFIQTVDSLEKKKQVNFLFYITTNHTRELEHILYRDDFTYPICIDANDEINKLNHLPEDARFQTFLLNDQNEVLIVGNPTMNPQIEELYLDVLKK